MDIHTDILMLLTTICCITLVTIIVTFLMLTKKLENFDTYKANNRCPLLSKEKPQVYKYDITTPLDMVTPLIKEMTKLHLPFSITPTAKEDLLNVTFTTSKQIQTTGFDKKYTVKCEKVESN